MQFGAALVDCHIFLAVVNPTASCIFASSWLLIFTFNLFFLSVNQKVKSTIVTRVTVRRPFVTYSSQNPWNFLDIEVIKIKEDDQC